LLLETADFARRAHHATIGPGVFLAQLRSWAVFGALTGAGSLVAGALASGTSASVRLPWASAVAATGPPSRSSRSRSLSPPPAGPRPTEPATRTVSGNFRAWNRNSSDRGRLQSL